MNDYLVSIIIPCYNVEKYLDRCLETVVNQTYSNLEIILVDDGSQDNTPAICDNWSDKDSRITVIHKENNGVASARNLALDLAKGDYISFVDSDDYVEYNFIEVLLISALKNDSDIVICGYQINDDDLGSLNFNRIDKDYAIAEIAKGIYKYGVLWNKLYKYNIVKNIRMPDLACSEDMVFNYYAFSLSSKLLECTTNLYHYRQNMNSTVHGNFKLEAYDAVIARKIILDALIDTDYFEYAVYGYISSCIVFINGCVRSDMFLDKCNEVRSSILNYKSIVYSSSIFDYKFRLKVFILSLSSRFYYKLLKMKG